MDVKRVVGIAATIALVSLQSGCSFLFVHGPPSNHAELASFDCSESNGWPIFDVIWAGLNGLGAATAGDTPEMTSNGGTSTGPSQDEVVAVGVTWLVVSGISAIYGFSKTSECRTAKHRGEAPSPGDASVISSRECQDQRTRALRDADRETDPRARRRMIDAAPVCAAPAAPPTMPAPAAAPASATAPMPAPAAAPAPVVPAPPAQSPTSSRMPVHRDLRSVHTRSLAMRSASADTARSAP